MTGEQILKKLEDNVTVSQFGHHDVDYDELGLGEVVEIDQHGGEDEGSYWYSVKHFVNHNVYIKTVGYYQSYNGTDFHDGMGTVVFPKEKVITVFS